MLKVLFQGDSITDCGRKRADSENLGEGYPNKVAQVMTTLYPKIQMSFVNKGISGNRVKDLLARYDNDILKIKPDIISILIGVNDTWRRYDIFDATTTKAFRDNYEKLLSKIKQDLPSTKIIIIEPFLLNTIPERTLWREDLDPKIAAVRQLARKYADAYIPLDGLFQQYVVDGFTDEEIAEDSVHPTDIGHGLIAKNYIDTLNNLLSKV